MPPCPRRRQPRRLLPRAAVSTLLALVPAAGPAGAGTSEGALAVTVEVVASCRVPAPSGLGSELVPCTGTGARTARSDGTTAPAGGASGSAAGPAARVAIEPSTSGPGYLTVIY